MEIISRNEQFTIVIIVQLKIEEKGGSNLIANSI